MSKLSSAVIAVALLLTACSSGSGESEPTPLPVVSPPTPAAATATTLPTLEPATTPPAAESDDSVEPAEPAVDSTVEPGVIVSDAVPPVEELMGAGLTEEQAECFRAAIDPDGDGIVNIDLFAEALACQ